MLFKSTPSGLAAQSELRGCAVEPNPLIPFAEAEFECQLNNPCLSVFICGQAFVFA
jgi:hypothetical protein